MFWRFQLDLTILKKVIVMSQLVGTRSWPKMRIVFSKILNLLFQNFLISALLNEIAWLYLVEWPSRKRMIANFGPWPHTCDHAPQPAVRFSNEWWFLFSYLFQFERHAISLRNAGLLESFKIKILIISEKLPSFLANFDH